VVHGRQPDITPHGTIALFNLSNDGSAVRITAGPDGNLWFTEFDGNRIGRITPFASAVEYYNADFDHYFITSKIDEMSKLDNGTLAGWTRTGLSFNVYSTATEGAASVCRFFSAAFDPRSSHFYTPFPDECMKVKGNPDWQFEGEGNDVFFIPVAGTDGTCASGTSPVYRLYNNGAGGAPNHRYTTADDVRDQMLAAGWTIEGNGPGFAFMCAPSTPAR
jgi:hypothetical protein